MNRLNIATHVAAKLNIPSLLNQCGDFAQRNYEMIYDKHNWRDVEFTYTASIPGGSRSIPLDGRVSRVASVMADGKVLDPINAVLGMQFDPTIFTRVGTPEVYEEVLVADEPIPGPDDTGGVAPPPSPEPVAGGVIHLKFYPQPVEDVRLVIVGIRKIAQLASDDDIPQIRNIDNCLIAYTEADTLERVKQYGMAAAKRQEADAKLADAIALDGAERSNFLRQIKPTSVTGGTLAELVDAVCARAKNWAPETKVLVKEIMRRVWLDLYDMTLWRESQMMRLISATGGSTVILPVEFDSIISIKQDEKLFQMLPADMNFFFSTDPSVFEATNVGTSSHYVLVTPVATPLMPAEAGAIQFRSTSDNDLSYVFIKGENHGAEQSETVKLNGTTGVMTELEYDTLLIVGKEITAGDLIIGATSTPDPAITPPGWTFDIGTIPANETSRSHIRFMLYRNVGEDLAVLVHGKRRVIPLVHDHDKPLLRGVGQALVYMTLAEALPLIGGDAALATSYGAKAEQAVKTLLDREVRQSSHKSRIVPIVENWGNYIR